MRLAEALRAIQDSKDRNGPEFRAGLACGFTPLHLQTFLQAELLRRFPERPVTIETGLYGDVSGNLQRLDRADVDVAIVAIEWSDLDPRLGFRGSHGWRPDQLSDIVATVAEAADRLCRELPTLADNRLVAVSLPQLPWPPGFPPPVDRGTSEGFSIQARVAALAADLCRHPAIRILQPMSLTVAGSGVEAFDPGGDLTTGFPYTVAHASDLANRLIGLSFPPSPMKGIVTDLDDTLWHGILGEDGVDGISWHLDRKTHGHALYQELLASLGESGVLLAAATKNDPGLTEEALHHPDLVLSSDSLWPVESHWGSKSQSVGRILNAWNVGADSVVFVDDSPRELAEVQAAFPEITTLRFPTGDDREILRLLRQLRDLCGKPTITEEDRIRAGSLRRDAAATITAETEDAAAAAEQFHRKSDSEIVVTWDAPDDRCFELINKTNQFNLNGRRIDAAAWRRRIDTEGQFVLSIGYRDKFGPLGKIAVVCGKIVDGEAHIDVWVMSCRAFSRFIEHQTVQQLFERLPVDALCLEFARTERNGPLAEFLETVAGLGDGDDGARIERGVFAAAYPQGFSRVVTQ